MPPLLIPKILVTLAALIAGFALAFGGASAATAHSELEESNPVQGSTVSAVTELVLTFGEAIVPAYSTVVLTDSSGTSAPLGTPTFDTRATVMTIPVTSGALPNGSYVAGYRIVSVDGHPIAGEVDFTVAGSDAPALVTPTSAATLPTEVPLVTDGNAVLLTEPKADGPNLVVIVGTVFAALVALGLVTVVLLVAIRRNRATPAVVKVDGDAAKTTDPNAAK